MPATPSQPAAEPLAPAAAAAAAARRAAAAEQAWAGGRHGAAGGGRSGGGQPGARAARGCQLQGMVVFGDSRTGELQSVSFTLRWAATLAPSLDPLSKVVAGLAARGDAGALAAGAQAPGAAALSFVTQAMRSLAVSAGAAPARGRFARPSPLRAWQLPVTVQATTPGAPKLVAEAIRHSVPKHELRRLEEQRAAAAATRGDPRWVVPARAPRRPLSPLPACLDLRC